MQKSNQVVLQKLHCIHAARRGYSAACARCARPHTNHALVNLQVRSGNRTTLYVYDVHVCTLVLQNRAEIHKLNRGIRSLFLVKLCSSLGIQTNLQWRKWVLYLCQIFSGCPRTTSGENSCCPDIFFGCPGRPGNQFSEDWVLQTKRPLAPPWINYCQPLPPSFTPKCLPCHLLS